jgi:hypothetical protein
VSGRQLAGAELDQHAFERGGGGVELGGFFGGRRAVVVGQALLGELEGLGELLGASKRAVPEMPARVWAARIAAATGTRLG